jgi:DHA2 family methylenomycin A resistance protein-like MFS transporter
MPLDITNTRSTARAHNVAARPRRRRWPALVTLCLAVLIAQVDTSVVNLAVRPIGAYFNASVAALQWVVDSYNLVYAVLLLTGGLLADLYGRRRVFMIGAAVFTGASVICAVAPAIPVLIAGRVLAGLGAALMLPASLAIIRVVWPDPAERGRALGIWAGCNGLSLAIGPSLGGILIAWFGWRGIFAIVVPLGVAVLAVAVPSIPESSDPRDRRFDLLAQVLGAVALGGLALAAIAAHETPLIAVGVIAVAAIAAAFFISVEAKRGAAALVPLDMFHAPAFRGAVLATTAMTFGMYGVLFLVPLTWQSTGALDATGAGLALIPMALVFVVASPFSAALSQRAGPRRMTSGGVAIIGVGLMLLGTTAGWGSLWLTEAGLALTGLGMGLATGPLLGVAVGAVASARSGTAAAIINVARMAGATLGVAVLGTAFASAGGGTAGLCAAMLLGGVVQLAGAAVAWREARPAAEAPV